MRRKAPGICWFVGQTPKAKGERPLSKCIKELRGHKSKENEAKIAGLQLHFWEKTMHKKGQGGRG